MLQQKKYFQNFIYYIEIVIRPSLQLKIWETNWFRPMFPMTKLIQWKDSVIFNVPPLPEQQKIASILSNVDNLIQNTDKLIEKTTRLKERFDAGIVNTRNWSYQV